MKSSAKLVAMFLSLGLIASANQAQAQIRGAGSKIEGNYDQFDQPSYTRPAPVYSVPTAAALTEARRAFSYEPQAQAAPCEPAPAAPAPQAAKQPAPAPQAARQATPPQSIRRFSYEPSYSAPMRSYVPSRTWQSGFRDAGSKVRGDF